MKKLYNTDKGIAMEVEIKNISNKKIDYNTTDFEVKDAQGRKFIFYDVMPGGKEPTLWFGSLFPQETIRAFITYVGDNNPYTVSYKPYDGQGFFIHLE